MNKVNNNMKRLKPFLVMEVLERANSMQDAGIDIIHLEVGEPDFCPPECVLAAAAESLRLGETHYTHSLGNTDLRAAIAGFYNKEYGVSVNPSNVVVTGGSSPAILLALMAMCSSGDEVIISNPGYACYSNFITASGAVPIEVNVRADDGFFYTANDIAGHISPKTRAVFFNSPMNPSGTVASDEVFRMLAQTGITVISDEIYHGLTYSGRARSMLEFTGNTVILNGFSKRFAMTGFRLGYMIVPDYLIDPVRILQQNLFICAPSTAQKAGIAALRCAREDAARMNAVYDQRRKFMIQRLRSIGFVIESEPQGAFYVFCDARKFCSDSYKFAFEILENAHVGITPGTDFGSAGAGFVRFSYANSIERIEEGLDRIEKYLSGRK